MKAWMEEAAAKKAAESDVAAEERERKRSITGATTAIESAPGPVPMPKPAQASAPAPQPSAPSKTLKPYGGYDPKTASAGAAAPAPAVSAPKPATKPSPTPHFAAETLVSSVQLTAPAKTWQPPVGYDPKSRAASAASEVTAEEQERKRGITGATPAVESEPAPLPRPAQASAPAAQASAISKTLPEEKLRALAEKWGYDPKDKSASALPAPAASVPRPPMTKPAPAPAPASAPAPTLAQTQVSVQASAAPSKKWQPPGGYDPQSRGASTASPASPEPAAGMPTIESAPAPLPKPAQASAPAPQPSAPSKTLKPYGGYDLKTASASSASPAPAASAPATGPKPTLASMPAPKPAPDPVSEPTSDGADGVGKETQTNTGRFSSLVDFDHTGMNDKVHLVRALLARLPRVCRVGSLTVGRGAGRSSERRSRRRWAVSAQSRRAASE
jgi:hypothetical protein